MKKSDIKQIVIHCSDTPNEREHTSEDVHRWHIERGFDGIGYHFVIRRSGLIEIGRPLYWQGAHCQAINATSIGICLIGRDQFTDEQFDALYDLIQHLTQREGIHADVVGHRDIDKRKTCPGFDVRAWWKNGGRL